ncbi:MAG: hypothetical protein IJ802_04215, partial [Kiritimatiellae bacterium]|nr:hypothetical protein [Kiritimatiellia bacterium]
AALFAVAAVAWFAMPALTELDTSPARSSASSSRLLAAEYEKIDAGEKGVHRYALAFDAASGALAVQIDQVGDVVRHVDEKKILDPNGAARLAEILGGREFRALDKFYGGKTARENSVKSVKVRIVTDEGTFETVAENALEPRALVEMRERLETFAQSELGIWAIQYSQEKLLELSRQSEDTADEKWNERDVTHGNVAAALAAYRQALFYLKTVDPKPPHHSALADKERRTEEELEKRYRELLFRCDRAINLHDWATAREELAVLCETLDTKDERQAAARAKMMEVENRLAEAKRGGKSKKGSRK